MTPEQIAERDPAVLQQELLDIYDRLSKVDLIKKTEVYCEAKAAWDIAKAQTKFLNEQARIIQSALKSVSQF